MTHAPEDPQTPFAPDDIVDGRYRIIEQVGRGGMSLVYRAYQASLDRFVAVKVMHTDLARQPEFRERFRLEAQNLATLRHPNIVQVVDFAADPDACYMVMEFLPGDTLALLLYRHVRQGTHLSFDDLISISRSVAEGLDYAHQRGLMHRDIKPANVLFDGSGAAVLTDFGIAKLTTTDVHLTAPDSLIGTPGYVSPELARGGQSDWRADLYSLGVVMFEMATGRLPFQANNALAMVRHHVETPPPRPASIRPDIPDWLEAVILRLLAKHPELRYQNAADMLADLNAHQAPAEQSLVVADAPVYDGGDTVLFTETPPPPNNLPAQLTAFVGRQALIQQVSNYLRQPDHRLVTLTGPGGVGKTRLSLQVAQELLHAFPDGVFFVQLDAIDAPARVLMAIEQTIGATGDEGGNRPVDRLRNYLRNRNMLLVLDNFEQVVDAAHEISELVAAAPDVRFLVTSRELLRVYGEHEFPIPPLRVPTDDVEPTASRWVDYAALLLFEARAKAARPDFELSATNIREVAELCRRLDGLPLAIELAAARIKLLSPAAMLKRMGGSAHATGTFKLLTTRARNLPPRQQTLRGAIDWSYQLLDAEEQALFRRISVFIGGRTVEAVATVCLDSDDTFETLELLASLVDKSLIQQRELADGELTFLMLATIYEFSRELNQEHSEWPTLQSRHVDYFLTLVEAAFDGLLGPQQREWLDRLELQHDNIRLAIGVCLATGRLAEACRFGASLWRFWRVRGHVTEGRAQLAAILSAAGPIADSLPYARAVLSAGHLAYLQSDFSAAQPLYTEARERLEAIGETGLLGEVLHNIGLLSFKQGAYDDARTIYEESMQHMQTAANHSGIASVRNSLGNLAWLRQDLDAAREHYGASIDIWRELGNKQNTAMVANNLGAVAMTAGDYLAAREIFTECIGIQRELGNMNGVALALSNLGEVALELHELAAAQQYLHEAMEIQRQLERKERIAILLEGFGRLMVRDEQPREAALFFGAAESLREVIKAPRPDIIQSQYEPDWQRARETLGNVAFAAAWAQGRNLTMQDAIARALDVTLG